MLENSDGPPGHGVYARAYPLYDERGWPNSLKLRRGTKWPPPAGFTGHAGETPSAENKAQWAREEPDGNIVQRLGEIEVDGCRRLLTGIDVDDYALKRGGETLAEAERRLGKLPPTYTATSRTDGISGIRMYLVPVGTKLRDRIEFPELKLGDIEIIQHHHRYVTCWPSTHPDTGNLYLWYAPDGTVMGGPPAVWDIPELPPTWVNALRAGTARSKSKKGQDAAEVWPECPYIVECSLTEGEMSHKVRGRFGAGAAACWEPSRHDSVRDHVLALLGMGARGEPGVFKAISLLGLTFIGAVTADGSRTEAEAEAEFMRFLTNPRLAHLLSQPWHGEEPDGAVIDEERLWARASIGYLRDFARARMVSPLAVLGAALVHVAARIPHTVVLPALVGSEGSLNLIVGLVGPSSVGKDAADAASQGALGFDWRRVQVVPMGSAEGIAGTYRPPGTDPDSPNPCTRAVFTAAEVDTWAGLAARNGSTLTAEIRLLYAGQQIGQGNVSKTTRRIVAAHSYRACVLMGIQPLRSAALLDASDGGLPQRVLFLPANDPDVPDQRPEDPKQYRIDLPEWPVNDTGTGNSPCHVLKVPDKARAVSDEQRRARLRAPLEDDASNGHWHFTQLKVAAALMALDGRCNGITEEDYDLAGIVMACSARTMQACRRTLAARAKEVNWARGRARADQEEAVSDHKRERCKRAVERWLDKAAPGEQITRHDLRNRKGVKAEDRPYFDDVVTELINAGRMSEVGPGHPTVYQKGTRVPLGTPPLTSENEGCTDGTRVLAPDAHHQGKRGAVDVTASTPRNSGQPEEKAAQQTYADSPEKARHLADTTNRAEALFCGVADSRDGRRSGGMGGGNA